MRSRGSSEGITEAGLCYASLCNMNFVAPQDNNLVPIPVPVMKLGKFQASRMIVKESFALLRQDKEVMWFPFLAALSSLVLFVMIGLLYFFLVLKGDTTIFTALSTENDAQVQSYFEHIAAGTNALSYGILFLYYVLSFLVVNFFQAGIFIIAHARMNGEDLNFMDGIRGARNRFGKILAWSLISATVGMILNVIENRSQFVGRIVAALLGATWAILTFFSLPALVIGNASVKDSFKESASIIRKTWGETIIMNVGVGLFFALLLVLGIIVFGVGVFLSATLSVVIPLGVLLIVYMIVLAVVSSTLSAIFKLALYEYARTGQVPAGFSSQLIRQAMQKK